MKRVNGLFEPLVSFENLYHAWKRARQGTGWNNETSAFSFHLEKQLFSLQDQLDSETYQPGGFRYFSIRDPKPRKIAVAPFKDRVVHHALVQILTPIFEPTFIFDSYATRKGKGTHQAIIRAQTFTRQCQWYYKMDVEHFFETVDHSVMLMLIGRKIKDKRVMHLVERIIRAVPGDKGLPIGNLTSQFFANIYLNPLDHFVKQGLGVKLYLRYMDDCVLFGSDKPKLKQCHQQMKDYALRQLRLKLKEKACWLNRTQAGLSFLGMRVFPGMLRQCPANRKRSLTKMAYRIKSFEKGAITEQQMADSLQCICAHMNYFC